MTEFDAVGFGALNVDKLFKVNRIAVAEDESFVTSYAEACGGSAANTIVGLARLGCKCGFIGKVATDREGKMLLDDFCKERVDTEGIVQARRGRSGTVMGFVDKKGNRALYISPGVNNTIKLDEINPDYASATRFLHLTSFVGEKSFLTQKKLFELLPESVKVSFDPGALYARMGMEKIEPIIKKIFVMLPNAGELELLTGEADYCRGADLLIQKGVKIVA
ncbi:MAG: carbohydrate kinase family protein, partial [Chloroflexota bacterium]